MSINKVILIGNVGREPEIRNMQNGSTMVNLVIATSDRWKDKSGDLQEKTEWHKIVVYNSGLVSIVQNYVKKGSKLYIEGSLQTRKYVDKDGIEKYTTEVILKQYGSSLQLLDHQASKPEVEEKGYNDITQKIIDGEIPF